jgi:hypothetical protein
MDDDALRPAFGTSLAHCRSMGRIYLENPVHGFGASGQDWSQFATVNDLGGPGVRVPGEPGDFLDGHARAGHKRHEGMTEFSWRPVFPNLRRLAGGLELAPDIGGV